MAAVSRGIDQVSYALGGLRILMPEVSASTVTLARGSYDPALASDHPWFVGTIVGNACWRRTLKDHEFLCGAVRILADALRTDGDTKT